MVDKLQVNPESLTVDQDALNTESADAAALAGDQVDIKHYGRDGEGDTHLDSKVEVNTAERPDWVAEKFWDAEKGEVRLEAMAKSNAELERALTAKGQETPEETPETPEETPETPDDTPKETPEETPESDSPIEFARQQFAETGELGDDAYAKLEAAGLDRATVDVYLEGVKAQEVNYQQQAYAKAGGTEDSYKEMISWASQNLNEAEVNTFNGMVNDPNTMTAAVEGMYLKMQKDTSSEGTPVQGNNTQVTGGDSYQSAQEMMKDISSTQYKTDKAFQAKVAGKIANAERRGVNLFS